MRPFYEVDWGDLESCVDCVWWILIVSLCFICCCIALCCYSYSLYHYSRDSTEDSADDCSCELDEEIHYPKQVNQVSRGEVYSDVAEQQRRNFPIVSGDHPDYQRMYSSIFEDMVCTVCGQRVSIRRGDDHWILRNHPIDIPKNQRFVASDHREQRIDIEMIEKGEPVQSYLPQRNRIHRIAVPFDPEARYGFQGPYDRNRTRFGMDSEPDGFGGPLRVDEYPRFDNELPPYEQGLRDGLCQRNRTHQITIPYDPQSRYGFQGPYDGNRTQFDRNKDLIQQQVPDGFGGSPRIEQYLGFDNELCAYKQGLRDGLCQRNLVTVPELEGVTIAEIAEEQRECVRELVHVVDGLADEYNLTNKRKA